MYIDKIRYYLSVILFCVVGVQDALSSTQESNAKAQYSTMAVDFGAVALFGTYEQTVTVTNVGSEDLIIEGLVFSDVTVFSSATSVPLTVSVGESKDLNITYQPVEQGNINKSLKVVCNSSSDQNTIQLKAQPFAVNELHVQPVAGMTGEEVTIVMTMNNMDAISGLQIEFLMPEQLEYVGDSFTLSDRKQDHTTEVSHNDGVLRIMAYSANDKPFTGNDGEIGSFKVKLVGSSSVTLTPSKTVLSATINNMVMNVVSDVFGGEITIQTSTPPEPSDTTDGDSEDQPAEKPDAGEIIIEQNAGFEKKETTDGSNVVAITDDMDASGSFTIPETIIYHGVEYKVVEIAANTFQSNTNLTEVTIPASIVSIGPKAFAGCTSLKSITVYNETPINLSIVGARGFTRADGSSVFEGVNMETCILYVPEGSVDLYKATPVWNEFKNIIAIGTTGINAIVLSDGETFDVFNLKGQRIKSKTTSLNGLSHGIYIINGKNFMK